MLVAVLTAMSGFVGLGRDVVIAAVFGAGPHLDAYFIAQGLMNVVLGLLGGAMTKATVPVVARQIGGAGGRDAAGRTVSVALSATLVVLGLGSMLMSILVGPVVAVLAPGFSGGQAELAESLTRIVLAATVLIAGTNLLAAAAQAHRRFFWAGVQGVPFNLTMIVAAGAFGPRYGVTALAVGFVAGSAARLLCQLVPLHAMRLRIRPRFDLSDPGFRAIVRLVPPLLLGSAVVNVNTLVDRAVGSLVGVGTISTLSYGWRVVDMSDTLLAASLVTALYPSLGAAAGDPTEFRRLVGRGLTVVSLVIAPVCAVLVAAATPVVAVVYERGDFDPADTARTASAVVWYAPALLAMAWREVAARASYALGDSRAPALIALAAMGVNVVGDVTLGLSLGVPGLAASTSLAIAVAAVANSVVLARRHEALPSRALSLMLGRVLAAAALATVAAALAVRTVDGAMAPGRVGAAAAALAAVATVTVVFLAALRVMRGPELDTLRAAGRGLSRRS